MSAEIPFRDAGRPQGTPHRQRRARPGCPGAEEHDPLFLETPAHMAERAPDSGDDHGAGPFDVVVEGKDAVPVAIEDGERVPAREVLPLHEGAREHFTDRLHQLVEKGEPPSTIPR